MNQMEKQAVANMAQGLTDEDKQIVVENLPLDKLKNEINRRNEQADRILANIGRAMIPVYERDTLTLEEKNAVIKCVRKAVGA